jgi:hypothetical protein
MLRVHLEQQAIGHRRLADSPGASRTEGQGAIRAVGQIHDGGLAERERTRCAAVGHGEVLADVRNAAKARLG